MNTQSPDRSMFEACLYFDHSISSCDSSAAQTPEDLWQHGSFPGFDHYFSDATFIHNGSYSPEFEGLSPTPEVNIPRSSISLPRSIAPAPPSPSSMCTFSLKLSNSNSPVPKEERRRAQNRAAQKAFRARQQQALSEALRRIRDMQKDLESANSKSEHFKMLYESLNLEHQRLLGELGGLPRDGHGGGLEQKTP